MIKDSKYNLLSTKIIPSKFFKISRMCTSSINKKLSFIKIKRGGRGRERARERESHFEREAKKLIRKVLVEQVKIDMPL